MRTLKGTSPCGPSRGTCLQVCSRKGKGEKPISPAWARREVRSEQGTPRKLKTRGSGAGAQEGGRGRPQIKPSRDSAHLPVTPSQAKHQPAAQLPWPCPCCPCLTVPFSKQVILCLRYLPVGCGSSISYPYSSLLCDLSPPAGGQRQQLRHIQERQGRGQGQGRRELGCWAGCLRSPPKPSPFPGQAQCPPVLLTLTIRWR